ncbi:WW domain-binding protein 4 isoform X2 [Poecilia reticulata]|uniref:WW domain binding protein 4 n=1 Tax=Poecilia reticulata TaxID=8081 RepID=A0A3P9Q046_POERE|nr:PREDICTED: WW domain-binding protein 4 isoform X2 [Poecilia reticulata]
MADYWKSQPRKFCQYCKCWIADNKPSIEFHERGKNHKENVAAKISEIKKKSVEKAKKEERMSKEFAAMEEAALKAYEEDLKRMQRGSDGSSSPVRAAPQYQPVPLVGVQPKKQQQQQKKKGWKASRKSREGPREMQVWVEGQSDEGHTYYYNTVTGVSQWEKPEGFQGRSSASAQSQQSESSLGSPWMGAVSPDGYTYFYNTNTGESSWEKPADFPSSEESETQLEKEENAGEDQSSQLETAPAGEERSESDGSALELQPVGEVDLKPKIPKINFRKRKSETEPSEKEGEDKVAEEALEEEKKETKPEEEAQRSGPKPETVAEVATAGKTPVKRPRAANPYGAWERIQQKQDPFANVDLQLPQTEESVAGTPAELPSEPKPKFKERVITSLGEEGGPASFRRNKAQNGKNRSLRQRDDDD